MDGRGASQVWVGCRRASVRVEDLLTASWGAGMKRERGNGVTQDVGWVGWPWGLGYAGVFVG